ncbi:hypothetical protein DPMN_026526 [Dreissena polymorpha]|uniref:Uncharacterized protein n=1 Tax=Dreissena polymorpha TaxID=45954 RepID=A0A9D4REE1_DREPO|nr:hypothetical protein DPMN_026526 [Dreissena polymorpha]
MIRPNVTMRINVTCGLCHTVHGYGLYVDLSEVGDPHAQLGPKSVKADILVRHMRTDTA